MGLRMTDVNGVVELGKMNTTSFGDAPILIKTPMSMYKALTIYRIGQGDVKITKLAYGYEA